NAGLARLTHLTELRALDVRYSRVTASGARELLARIPGVRVLVDDPSKGAARRAVEAAPVKGKGEEAVAKWLRSIGAQVRLRDGHAIAVSLASTSITDREVAMLQELPELEELSLRDTEISDLGAAHLSSIRRLRKLDLRHTLLSDSALGALAPLTGLQSLDLSHTLVEGTGLGAFAGLAALRDISFSNAPLRDEGLAHLGALTCLEGLSLR